MGGCRGILCFILFVGVTLGAHDRAGGRSGAGRRLQRDQHDALKLARCDAKCWKLQKPNKGECASKCLRREQKPGECQAPEDLNIWDAACLPACEFDAQCQGMLKCCPHRCGATCQHPRGLHLAPGLPSIPQNITVKEKRRGRTIRVKWSPSISKHNSLILYIIEERHHVGKHFVESRLCEWTPRQRTKKTNISLKNVVKPGRWYQFRVSAVNENGTKGFSKPSSPFSPSLGPRAPGPPQNLSTDTVQFSNGTFNVVLRWKPPLYSDLPIQKYKVYWGKRRQGVEKDLDSVLVKHQSVIKTFYELKGLQPKSLYFLQVQALVQFGTMKLKSEKSAIFFNTTRYSNDSVILSEGNSSKRSADHQIKDLQLQKIYWNKDQLLARITWRPVYAKIDKNIRYSVQWWTGPCNGEDKGFKSRKQMGVTTEVSKFELYDLNFGCKYIVHVNKIPDGDKSTYRASTSFTTPSCEQLQLKMKREKIKCN